MDWEPVVGIFHYFIDETSEQLNEKVFNGAQIECYLSPWQLSSHANSQSNNSTVAQVCTSNCT